MDTTLSSSAVAYFRTRLLKWYASASRDLPWRKTRDPYAVAVSELMLQQTQVDRVIPKYHAWMKQFPTLEALASSSTGTVIAAWQGLGYNRRAKFLHVMAQTVVKEHSGVFPNTLEGLEQLPGIGPYTARAVMNFAFEKPAPIVETNVRRVLSRFFFGFTHTLTLSEDDYWTLATRVTPKKDHYNFNQALMDFGAVVCVAKKPQCAVCPFQQHCASYPKILTASSSSLRVTKTTNETQYFGHPRRIWRGKILKYLHDPRLRKTGATLRDVGNAIQSDYDSTREEWLIMVLDTLIADGMVIHTKTRYHLPV